MRIFEETLESSAREMTHEQGWFYSPLNADSEGEEGKFHGWTLEEIREVLKDDGNLIHKKSTVYVCEGFVCKLPATEIQTLIGQLNS